MIRQGKHGRAKNYKNMGDKRIIGLIEPIVIYSAKGESEVIARIDTGATKSSIDFKLAADLGMGPIIKTRFIKSASGNALRPVVKARIKIAGKTLEAEFTLADRSHMKYKALIGHNVLLNNDFLIDPNKQ
ncbi:MAG: RimK/LysX family protein [Candidatus Woesearchaeota archaeon]|nr:RimK/LysX family protein [Candidatus Woesearchaeota archaeon]